jgi:hypothetical protein
VNVGITSTNVASVASAAVAGPAPSIRNDCSRWRSAPSSTLVPTTPFAMIMTVAYIVSRGSAALAAPLPIISITISDDSITVTASASASVPNGSPTRCAITSAW